MRSGRADLRPERADIGPEKADLRSGGADLRADLVLEWLGGGKELDGETKKRKNGEMEK